jgi:hypothetical protein
VGLTVALIVFTPLKQYLPGYGSLNARRELQALKLKTDSLEQSMNYKDQYLVNIKRVLTGDVKEQSDTTVRTELKPDKEPKKSRKKESKKKRRRR